jgi:hypothetical protein
MHFAQLTAKKAHWELCGREGNKKWVYLFDKPKRNGEAKSRRFMPVR